MVHSITRKGHLFYIIHIYTLCKIFILVCESYPFPLGYTYIKFKSPFVRCRYTSSGSGYYKGVALTINLFIFDMH